MRTEKHRIDTAASLVGRFAHLVVDGVERPHVEQAPADAGLIRCNHYPITHLGKMRNGFQAAWNGFPFIRCLDKGGAVIIDDTVTIENDQFHSRPLSNSQSGNIGHAIHRLAQLGKQGKPVVA